MGRKNGAVSASEPVAEQQTHNTTTQIESLKKNKHNLQNEENTPKIKQEELNLDNGEEGNGGNGAETVSATDEPITVTGKNPKRKQEELNLQNDTEKKSKKKKKHNVEEEEGNGSNGAETVSASDEPIAVTGKNADDLKYAAVKSFVGLGLPENVLECCKCFEKPLPIQSRAWPFLLDGRDLIGIAATGSGKTLAFGLPAIMHVLNKRKSKGFSNGRNPLCLMLSPTRELAQQISDVLCDAGKSCGVESVCWYGETSQERQISALRSGIDIVIGTPGGIKDLVEMRNLCLKEVSFVVHDEADRMLDMGFGQKVRSILGQTCSVHQMVMFSATWPLEFQMLANKFMDPNPVKLVVGSEDSSAHHDVTQTVKVLNERSRDEHLLALLKEYLKSQENRVLIFVLYKYETIRVQEVLQRGGWMFVSISGDTLQHERTLALSLFNNGTCPLMIATDVAARGLDIPDVEVVINFSFPLVLEDYLHRIGRTGRAGKKGVAHTFLTPRDKRHYGELVYVLREAKQVVPNSLLDFGKGIADDAPKSKKITFPDDD